MKVSAVALTFLILAVDLGSQIPITKEERGSMLTVLRDELPNIHDGLHRPADCCPGYVSGNIRCSNMVDYFETSSGCTRAAVIFITKRGRSVCANPRNESVQNCMIKLKSGLLVEGRTKIMELAG